MFSHGMYCYSLRMGERMMFGPYTAWVAARMQERRQELGHSYDRIVALSGLSKPTVYGALNGKQAIAIEAYMALCSALTIDAGRLLDEAEAQAGAESQVVHGPWGEIPDWAEDIAARDIDD